MIIWAVSLDGLTFLLTYSIPVSSTFSSIILFLLLIIPLIMLDQNLHD